MSDTVRSAGRVLDLLEYFAGRRTPATLAEVSTAFSMPKSSTLGLLRTLLFHGYLNRDSQGCYSLNDSFRTHGFGWGGDQLMRLVAIARPVMDELMNRLNETVGLLALTEDGYSRLLVQSLTSQAVRFEAAVGELFPSFCSASGRIWLSCLPQKERNEILKKLALQRFTASTVTDLKKIQELIVAAGKQGYCCVADE